MKIGFGQFSIQFLIFQITEKMKIDFSAIFNSLHDVKSNSIPFNRTLHFRPQNDLRP